jgi:hypothetical protein
MMTGKRVIRNYDDSPTPLVGTVMSESFRNAAGEEVAWVRWERDGFITSQRHEFIDELVTTNR